MLQNIDGKDLNFEDALILASSGNIDEICEAADRIRRRYYSNIVTFSSNVFIPLTNYCRNRCGYCGFRHKPGDPSGIIMRPDEVKNVLIKGKEARCTEALFTFGEKPEEKYFEVKKFLEELGYSSIIDYLYDLCLMALEIGLLPHSNPGILDKSEIRKLKQVNASIGLMLESSSKRLCEAGGPHEHSPGKLPEKRIKTVKAAGELKVPFTSGILVGIGETLEERIESIYVLKKLHEKYDHIQEIIIQNFNPKPNTPMEDFSPPTLNDIILTAAITRLVFKGKTNIQIPPNLNIGQERELLISGMNDWGGISPITVDEINPNHHWPSKIKLGKITREAGFSLRERLPIYPKYIQKNYISSNVAPLVHELADNKGYRKM
ncbi:MAG: 7,8-didemethyl-8-hydroxy-5-deazariboflavin synthase CofG [Candidatus Jordarchaeum sp.]|uniref:7,8-didemethyl-8-hydroxy-5-deazariboflavin synthase CofG n=1 Tax=Candidatus Jordarchaeum sp. TaxID=2823881 RepID=UPI00404998CF